MRELINTLPPFALSEDTHYGFELKFDDILGHICCTLVECLADTENDAQVGVDCSTGLVSYKFRVLEEQRSAFRMSFLFFFDEINKLERKNGTDLE